MKRREARKHSWAKVCAWVVLLALVAVYVVSLVTRVSYGTAVWQVLVWHGDVTCFQQAYFSGRAPVPGWAIGEARWYGPGLSLPQRMQGGGGGYMYIAPLWIPVIAAAGVVVWLTLRGRRSLSSSACCACGYDCEGVPEAAVCPECGKARALPE